VSALNYAEMFGYLKGKHRGILYYTFVAPSKSIGGYGNPNTLVEVLNIERKLSKALLTLVVSGKDLRRKGIMWKVSLGRVSLTREFKPQRIVRVSSSSYAAVVFDVSNLIKNTSSYELKITNESATPLRVETLSLVGLIPVEKAEVELSYWVGPLSLKNGETYSFRLPNESPGEAQLTLSMTTVSKASALLFQTSSGFSQEVEGIIASDYRSLRIKLNQRKELASFKYISSDNFSASRLFLNEVLYYKPLCKGPIITLDLTDLGDHAFLHLKNKGDLPADKVLVIGLSAGKVIYRKIIENILPTAEKTLTVDLDASIKRPIVFRAIYNGVWGQELKTAYIK